MTLSEELAWRGFVNQTTFKDIKRVDGDPITFYFGVDPSASSMTVGNLAAAMMVRLFAKYGHRPVLLVGGATGLIGDPDGKADERNLKTPDEVAANKHAIAAQYQIVLGTYSFTLVDNYDWFKDMGYLQFLREVGKHVPLRQMVQRDFVQSRISEDGSGISYAEFSYVLIQAYDFVHLYREEGVTLQLCGSDQWGNSIAGVDLIRRLEGGEAHVWSLPLVVNKATGKKFGKSEEGAVWLDPDRTTPTAFYQFWINVDDEGVEDYLKIYTELEKGEIERIMEAHRADRAARIAQTHLAREVTRLVHGEETMEFAEVVTGYLVGRTPIAEASETVLEAIRQEMPAVTSAADGDIAAALLASGLAESLTEARRLLGGNAIAVNGQKINRPTFEPADFVDGRLLLRKGKKYKDSALVELA
ncbi:MAG TPA: tyrosine--tRNA ligase [Candidatus Saccharimonadales bacterium]|nr:tyrosine--tRNA ligase [Candidatus Saccharimonadales bacterium]